MKTIASGNNIVLRDKFGFCLSNLFVHFSNFVIDFMKSPILLLHTGFLDVTSDMG